MPLSQNQFSQKGVKGQVDLHFNTSTISCRVKSDETDTLVAGQAVLMADTAGGTPEVTNARRDAGDIFGFVNYNFKKNGYKAGDALEISFFKGNVMYMEANEAISRGAEVAIVVAGNKVKTAANGERIVGRAFDKALADGDLIRVVIDLPGAQKA